MRKCLPSALALVLALAAASADGAPLRVVLDVRTNHSDGRHTMEELVRMAKARHVDAIAFTDHDRQAIRIGLAPIERWLGYSYERPSLFTTGVEDFFAELAAVRRRHPEMVFLAGVEATPGYAWRWSFPWHWTLIDAEKHMIVLGLERPAQVKRLPSFQLAGVEGPPRFSMLIWGALGFVLALLLARRGMLWAVLALGATGGMVAWILMRPAPDPAATMIQAARKAGLFVAWAHPGTHSGVRTGPFGVQLATPPYTDEVFATPADGFAALYGDSDDLCEPGGAWDQWMRRWARGAVRPVWAIAAGDFHAEGEANEFFGNFPMDVWAGVRTPEAVLAAIRAGHAVAWGLPKDRDLFVRALWLEDARGVRARPGDRLRTTRGDLALSIAIADKLGRAPIALPLQIVVDGHAIPWRIQSDGTVWRRPLALGKGAHIVRVRMRAGALRMEANPIAVVVR